MKESTLSKFTAAGAIAKGMAQKALAPNPNPQWTEYEMRPTKGRPPIKSSKG